jgi:hypothetical protein
MTPMANDLALMYARTLAELREAAWVLLHHDTEENRRRVHQLVCGDDRLIRDGCDHPAGQEHT